VAGLFLGFACAILTGGSITRFHPTPHWPYMAYWDPTAVMVELPAAMDLDRALRDLHEELDTLNRVIADVEELARTGIPPTPSRPGRKSMHESERQLVSERMKKYWAAKREQRTAAGSASQAPSG
jgi:hypothetical protein